MFTTNFSDINILIFLFHLTGQAPFKCQKLPKVSKHYLKKYCTHFSKKENFKGLNLSNLAFKEIKYSYIILNNHKCVHIFTRLLTENEDIIFFIFDKVIFFIC